MECCEILNKQFPNHSFILNLPGMAYQGLQNHPKAIDFFESALEIERTNIAAMNNLANSLKNTGQYLKADKLFQKIIKISPSYIQAYNNYANLKDLVNDVEGSIKLYNQALLIAREKKISPIVILSHLAGAYHSLNKKKESIEIVNEILKNDPHNAEAHKALSSLTKYSKKNKETMIHISRMKNILNENNLEDNQKGIISFALGKAYDELNDADTAIKFLSAGNKIIQKIRVSNINKDINIMNDIKKIYKNID